MVYFCRIISLYNSSFQNCQVFISDMNSLRERVAVRPFSCHKFLIKIYSFFEKTILTKIYQLLYTCSVKYLSGLTLKLQNN